MFIDDASGRITAHFSPTETAFAYMAALRQYIGRYGLPRALYHDRDSVFTINTSDKLNQREPYTQFGRILDKLGIESINAYSPQAKGRVERANKTLQDRLVKFLRKQGIASIDQANACLPEFIDSYNRRFSLAVEHDAHHDAAHWTKQRLDRLFTKQYTRTADMNLGLQYEGQWYQITSPGGGHHIKGQRVKVVVYESGKIELWFGGKRLKYRTLERRPTVKKANHKTINHTVDQIVKTPYKPGPDHPWRRYPIKQAKPNMPEAIHGQAPGQIPPHSGL